MKKFLKWILAGIGVLVVLFVLAAVVLPLLVDPNSYKEEIRKSVFEDTGRELTIGGDIKWTVFPSVGLGFSQLEVGNRGGFGEKPMLVIGEADVSVKLIPLFSRKVEIGRIRFDDVSVNLQRKANGKNNWEDISGTQSGHTETSASGSGLDTLTISGIDISNANVTWDDSGHITSLSEFGLHASNIGLGRPFKLDGGFSVNLAQSQLSGKVEFEGLVSSRADGSRYGIEDLGITFKGTQGPVGESIDLDMGVSANAELDLAKDQAALSDFVFRFHDIDINGGLNVTSLSHQPKFDGQLRLETFSPKSFMQALGTKAPATADEVALTSLQAEMNFAGSAHDANMRNLVVKFDKSIFKGNLKVENFDLPKLAFDFQIDRLNLDEYLPAAATETESEPDLMVEAFRGFTGGGDFSIGKLVVAGLTATEVSIKMVSNGKGIRLFPISAQFYDGQHRGDVRINASGNRPILVTTQQLTGIRAESLLMDLTGSARLEGVGDFNLTARTDLTNARSTTQKLAGKFDMSFQDGAIVGIDVAETIRSAKAALGQKTEVKKDSGQKPKTDFSELSMSGVIKQGVIKSDDLMMRSPLLRVTGKGQVNLVKESVNYKIKPVLVGSLEGQGGQDLDDLKGITVPVKLTGNLYDPDVSVDILAAITGSQKDALVDQLLGSKDKSGTANEKDKDKGSREDDPAKALIDGLFGSKKDKKKKKEGGGN